MRTATLSTRATTTALRQSVRALSAQCRSRSWFNGQSRCDPPGTPPSSLVVGSVTAPLKARIEALEDGAICGDHGEPDS
jgi:hypothetical protein